MRNLENSLNIEKLQRAKQHLVPYIFSENYFQILKNRLANKKLSYNEQYYYNHFIKKKLMGMMELFDIEGKIHISNKEMITKDRLKKEIELIKKYSRKHKNMKLLITGSFLYKDKYNDIDIFAISEYSKEDYKEGKIHVNFLPSDIQNTLFFNSLSTVSISNFIYSKQEITEEFKLSDILHQYEVIILLMMQNNDFIAELRELVLRTEYVSGKVILNSIQLSGITDKIKKSRNPIKVLNKYIVSRIINSYQLSELKKELGKFIEKNSIPEKGQKLYPNWVIYNQTYREALEVVA